MSWTKEKLIRQAFTEIGLGSSFNVTPAQIDGGLDKLESMMAMWSGNGIRLGYISSDSSTAGFSAPSGIPDLANEAVYLNLAVRLAPSFGKTLAPTLLNMAKAGHNALLSRATFPPQQQLPSTLPRGAGNKTWRNVGGPFMPTPTDPLLAEQGGDQIEFD